jgi:hypothetical protein
MQCWRLEGGDLITTFIEGCSATNAMIHRNGTRIRRCILLDREERCSRSLHHCIRHTHVVIQD